MIAPLMPKQVAQALSHGSQAELDEFNRLVEKLHMQDFAPNLVTDFDRSRLQELKGKLFPGKMATASQTAKKASAKKVPAEKAPAKKPLTEPQPSKVTFA